MSDQSDCLAVIEKGADADRTLAQLRAVAQVTQVVPPRLALLARPPAAPVAGVTVWTADLPDRILAGLTPAERIFVGAWRSRRSAKRRPDDGLPWDTPGHRPPDRPDGAPSMTPD